MVWLSLVPALVTIILTFKTKKLIVSLFVGVLAGTLINNGIAGGVTAIGEYMMDAVADKESAYTLSFLIAFGSLAELIEMAGGIAGFSEKVGKWAKSEKGVLGWAWLLSIITFFDSAFHTIAVGTVLSPVLNKVKGSKEKFAFILSVTSLQLILLIPIATAYIGYMVTLVTNNIKGKGVAEAAYSIVAKSMLWNFFSWAMLLIGLAVTVWNMGFGRFRLGKAEEEAHEFTEAHLQKEELTNEAVEEYPKNSMNLIVPVAMLLISTIFFFWWTGKGEGKAFFAALSSAKFSVSIFSGVIVTLLFTTVYFIFQKISLAEIETHIVKGGEKILSLVIILILSWALTSVTQDMGFNKLVSAELVRSIPKFLIPAILFLFSGVISYMLGSSWATWALMMPLAMNFAINSGVNIPIMVGTVWAGGAVADIVSPLSAQMADTTFGEHLTTAFPYVIAGVTISTTAYVIVGIMI